MTFMEHIKKIREKCLKALNIIKFLRGCWWGADPSTLLIFFKSFIRPIIDYASFLYFPTKKSKALALERIQYQGIRLSLGYRISTPTNIIIAEAKPKVMNLVDRAKFLGSKFILRSLSNSVSPSSSAIQKHFYNSLLLRRNKLSIFQQCIEDVIPFKKMIISDNVFRYNYEVLNTCIPINIELGNKLKLTEFPNLIFTEHINSKESTSFYTDGSKDLNRISVGSACVNLKSGLIMSRSINKLASIYTAESV